MPLECNRSPQNQRGGRGGYLDPRAPLCAILNRLYQNDTHYTYYYSNSEQSVTNASACRRHGGKASGRHLEGMGEAWGRHGGAGRAATTTVQYMVEILPPP